MNQLTVAGYLGGDAEVRYSEAGTAITTFSLPAESGWGDNKKVTWVKCVLFGRKGEKAPHGMTEYLTKGKYVVASGEMEGQEWNGKNGKMFTIQMVAANISLGPQAAGGGGSKPSTQKADDQNYNEAMNDQGAGHAADAIDDDDIPF